MQINRQSYEAFFLLYTDGELSLDERKAVEEFISENPDLEQELILLQASVLTPDENVVFENKELLYKKHDTKVIALPWYRIAVAVILLIAFGISGWLYFGKPNESMPVASNENTTHRPLNRVDEPSKSLEQDNKEPRQASPQRSDNTSKRAESGLAKGQSVAAGSQTGRTGDEPAAAKENAAEKRSHNIHPAQESMTHVEPEANVVNQYPHEEVSIAVEPADITSGHHAIIAAVPEVRESFAQPVVVEYVESDEDDMIYFANTALPKKTKLRGVFRKATRILDKVTSL